MIQFISNLYFAAEHIEPHFTRELTDGTVKEMDNFVFQVQFKGNPKPEISWYHDNLLIHQQQAFQVLWCKFLLPVKLIFTLMNTTRWYV